MKEGWEIIDLGSVCHVQRGLTYSGKDTVDISDQVVLRATNIDLGTGKLIFDELKYLREDLEIKPVYALKKDSLLICFSSGSKSHLGKIALVYDDYPNFFFGGFIGQINPSEKIDSKYLFYCLSSETYKDYISNLTDGVNINNLKATDLKSFQIPLPPLPEQQRIVSILDEAFAAIDKAKANAEQNLQNAKELFENYLQGVFENNSDGWIEKKLGEVCNIGDGNYSSKYPKASEFVQSGVPFLTATNLKNGTVIPDGIRFISKEQHLTLTKGHIIQGDLVIVVRGSSTGNNSIVPKAYAGSNLNSQLAFLRVKDKTYLDSDYLFAVFNSPGVMKKIKAEISGAAQPQLPNNKLLDVSINIPSLEVQQTIVRQLDALRAETQKLEAVYQKKIDDLEELKKSILQKAFAGELKTEKAVAV